MGTPAGVRSGFVEDLATTVELSAALASGATIVDIRAAGAAEAVEGVFRTIAGARSVLWDGEKICTNTLDPSMSLIIFCRSGRRAARAAAFLRDSGYEHVLNGGGPAGPADLWNTLVAERGEVANRLVGLQQVLSTEGSSTCTYILTCAESKEAVIIDPVVEHIERDLAHVHELGCTLKLALNTHVHADHVTGSGMLKQAVPGLRSCISKVSGAVADEQISPGSTVTWAGGKRALRVLSTPGHTSGCLTYYDEAMGTAFTGDALLIGGCGRTDFQQGDAQVLYDSIHHQLFTLPPATLVLPGHDYKGRSFSTIAAERDTNPRLAKKTKEEFVTIMAQLDLPYPKKMDTAVPANMVCGV